MEKQRVEEIAANRLKLISPLLDTALDRDKKQMLKEQICIQSGLSERTIRRYLNLYQEKGFEGLKPQSSGRGGNSIIPEEVMQEAIALRREVPKRSINEIIRILEWEGKVEPGALKRSTLQDQLSYRGYSSRQMRTYASSVTSARRFQKPWRNYLWQSDIKYGIYVNGQPTYMVCFLDDCTRNVMHSEFYSTLDQKIVQDCFRKALLKFGAPDSVFFDNGVQFRTHWIVFCKPFLHKIAKSFCRLLHLHFVGNCKTTAGSYSASHKPLQIIFSCYNTRYGNGSSEFSSSCACSLK